MAEITIKQAFEQGSTRLNFTCYRPDVRPGGAVCGQTGSIEIELALATWGEGRRLDEFPLYCSRCGSKDFVGVMGDPPGRIGKRGRR
ncbi:MAG: hypothetical protein WAU68_07225 [Vitreimonas sp.]